MNLTSIRSYRSARATALIWTDPVTDRTAADVERVKELQKKGFANMTTEEKTEWNAGLKGALNRSDLERIEGNIKVLLTELKINRSSGHGNIPEYPKASYYQTMHDNVEAIRAGYSIHADTPQTPDLPWNTWQKWNDAEKILRDVHEVVMAQFSYYAGELYSGDETGYLL